MKFFFMHVKNWKLTPLRRVKFKFQVLFKFFQKLSLSKIYLKIIFSKISSQNLFSQKKIIIIENLFSKTLLSSKIYHKKIINSKIISKINDHFQKIYFKNLSTNISSKNHELQKNSQYFSKKRGKNWKKFIK